MHGIGYGFGPAGGALLSGLAAVASLAAVAAPVRREPALPAYMHDVTPKGNNGKRHGTPREFRPTGTKRQRRRMI
jgi:hypothetical protein